MEAHCEGDLILQGPAEQPGREQSNVACRLLICSGEV